MEDHPEGGEDGAQAPEHQAVQLQTPPAVQYTIMLDCTQFTVHSTPRGRRGWCPGPRTPGSTASDTTCSIVHFYARLYTLHCTQYTKREKRMAPRPRIALYTIILDCTRCTVHPEGRETPGSTAYDTTCSTVHYYVY